MSFSTALIIFGLLFGLSCITIALSGGGESQVEHDTRTFLAAVAQDHR